MRLHPPPALLYAFARPWLGTLRVHQFGLDRLRAGMRLSPRRNVVVCLWHQSLLSILAPAQNCGLRLAALASLSGDGAIIADFMERVGIRTVRGSSARGSARAAKAVMEAVDDGWNPIITVDGPRGPAKVVKIGALEIARTQGVPIMPIAARSSNELQFNSWDGFRVPLPGAHVAVIYGQAVLYPPHEPSSAELAQRCADLRGILEGMELEATRRVQQFAPKSRYRPRREAGGVSLRPQPPP